MLSDTEMFATVEICSLLLRLGFCYSGTVSSNFNCRKCENDKLILPVQFAQKHTKLYIESVTT